jgi:plastocyanin
MNDGLRLYKSAIIEAKNAVNTHFVFQVFNVSEDGRFVDIVCNHLVWELDNNSEDYVINSFGEEIPASPKKPEVICDVPVKQFKEGDLIIRKRPKIGDVGYIECMYQDIGTWKAEGGFQAPMSINIHDRSSCVFVNGVPNHKESDTDPLPAENITQIKTKDISIEWQDTVESESEEEQVKESHIKVKNRNMEYELKEVDGENGTENTFTFKTKNVTFQIVDTPDGANVTMSIPDNMTITAKKFIVNGETEFNGNSTLNGDNTTTGKITASDDVLGGGISLKDHSHDFNYIGAGQGSSQQSGTTEKPS